MKKITLFATFFALLIFIPKIVRADIIFPPLYGISGIFSASNWLDILLLTFLLNLAINVFIFGLAFYIFVRKIPEIYTRKNFIISWIMVSVLGYIADIVIAFAVSSTHVLFGIMIIPYVIGVFALITLFDMLVCKYFLKLDTKRSIYIGIWMGILTNPFFYPFF